MRRFEFYFRVIKTTLKYCFYHVKIQLTSFYHIEKLIVCRNNCGNYIINILTSKDMENTQLSLASDVVKYEFYECCNFP